MSTSVLILGMRYSNFWLCYVVFYHKIYFYHFSQQGHSGRKYSIYLLVFMLLAGSFICFWEVASSSHGTLHLRIFWCPLIFPGSQENLFWLISFHWTIQNISLQMHLILEWNSDFFRPVLHTLIRGEWLWTPSVFYLSLGWVLSDYVQSFLCLRGKKGRNKNKFLRSAMTLPR